MSLLTRVARLEHSQPKPAPVEDPENRRVLECLMRDPSAIRVAERLQLDYHRLGEAERRLVHAEAAEVAARLGLRR